jgi:hypothetical protein
MKHARQTDVHKPNLSCMHLFCVLCAKNTQAYVYDGGVKKSIFFYPCFAVLVVIPNPWMLPLKDVDIVMACLNSLSIPGGNLAPLHRRLSRNAVLLGLLVLSRRTIAL